MSLVIGGAFLCIAVVSAAAAIAADDADSPPKGAYRQTGLIVPASATAATVVNRGSSSSMWKLMRWELWRRWKNWESRSSSYLSGTTTPLLSLLSLLSSLLSSGLPPPMLRAVPGASLSRWW